MAIHFTCPHCGTTTDIGDQYAGRSGPCVHCGKPIMVPGTAPEDSEYPLPPRPGGPSPWMALLIVAALAVPVMAILAFLLLPAFQDLGPRHRVSDINNLKLIGLAMHNYHGANGCFPPAYIADEKGRPMHSWRVLLSPYLESAALLSQYDMKEPWNGPHNSRLAPRAPEAYRPPNDSSAADTTDYLMVVGPGAFSSGPTSQKLSQLGDRASKTPMVIEIDGSAVPWMKPQDCDLAHADFPPNRRGGFNVLFADGSVQFLTLEKLKASLPPVTAAPTGLDPPE
jgi:prepilin-type processing-associated H-X9-DG protein